MIIIDTCYLSTPFFCLQANLNRWFWLDDPWQQQCDFKLYCRVHHALHIALFYLRVLRYFNICVKFAWRKIHYLTRTRRIRKKITHMRSIFYLAVALIGYGTQRRYIFLYSTRVISNTRCIYSGLCKALRVWKLDVFHIFTVYNNFHVQASACTSDVKLFVIFLEYFQQINSLCSHRGKEEKRVSLVDNGMWHVICHFDWSLFMNFNQMRGFFQPNDWNID